MRVILASDNAGKLLELRALLETVGLELMPQGALGIGSPPETGASFRENALLKARHAAERSGSWALADDSGLEVAALGGRPGIHSARFSGPAANDAQNNEKLLELLRDVPDERRHARYRCCIALVRGPGDPVPLIAEGSWEGRIARDPRGTAGFGYDPVFVPAGFEKTAAELEPGVKNASSHRGQALKSLQAQLREAQSG